MEDCLSHGAGYLCAGISFSHSRKIADYDSVHEISINQFLEMDCPNLSSSLQAGHSYMIYVLQSTTPRERSVNVFHPIRGPDDYQVLHLDHAVDHCKERCEHLI